MSFNNKLIIGIGTLTILASLALSTLSSALAATSNPTQKATEAKVPLFNCSRNLGDKNSEMYKKMREAMSSTLLGRQMFQAMEKGDSAVMSKLMAKPEAMKEMSKFMGDNPEMLQYHQKMHSGSMQQMHQNMMGSGSMNDMMGSRSMNDMMGQ